jgi:HK97 family phage prohead protease
MYNLDFGFELKSVGQDGNDVGTFDGYVSVYGNVDFYDEVVVPGAFDETVKAKNGMFPLLWQHHPDEPIGSFLATPDDIGLHTQGRICLGTEKGREAYALLKMKETTGFSPIQGMSIGFNTKQDDYDDDGRRLLKKIDLWEGSFVTFPANEKATIGQVKNLANLEAAIRLIAQTSPKDFHDINDGLVLAARNVLGRVEAKKDDADRIAEFVRNEVLEWMK